MNLREITMFKCRSNKGYKKNDNVEGSNVALVTGASSGIGLATARALLQAGYRVFGTSRKGAGEIVNGITILAVM